MNIHSNVRLRSGRQMPVMGQGTWKLKTPAETVVNALKMGYRMIDSSHDYGTQPGVAKGIKNSGKKRDDFYLVTKVEETENAYEVTKRNLRELGVDYADLILIHRPPKKGNGEELWQGLIQAKKEGMTKDIGVSNYTEAQMEALIDDSGEVPVVNQIEWSPFGHSDEMWDFCEDHHIIIQAYSPLTHGKRLKDKRLVAIAKQHDKTPAQVIIRWNLQFGTVPIVKATSEKHLKENLDVFNFTLSADDMLALDSLNETYSALGSSLQYA